TNTPTTHHQHKITRQLLRVVLVRIGVAQVVVLVSGVVVLVLEAVQGMMEVAVRIAQVGLGLVLEMVIWVGVTLVAVVDW
ncbi:MAG: hypothetical protein OXI96_02115, partial [Acidimicrobiaceae bacterium]|nr:hypothetical protein [Acidimicrobiaceae bacterium]